jgi:hypothetical protein
MRNDIVFGGDVDQFLCDGGERRANQDIRPFNFD